MRFASGCVANITSSRVSMDKMRKIRIFEEDAYMSTDYSEQEVRVYRKKGTPADRQRSPMDSIAVETLPVERGEPLKNELESFIECVRQRRRPVVAGEDALAALELAHQILENIKSHPS
jgi:predicted dehydrogenase